MRANPLREKLRAGRMSIAAMLRLPDVSAAEMMAGAGIDMICIDNEHYPFSPETVERIVAAVQVYGASCFIRLPDAEPARIAQYMDMGLAGIKIPHVETGEQTRAIVEAVKYATAGSRGFCPITRAADYGYGEPPARLAQAANEDTLIALMVETKRGLENIDEILGVAGVDLIAIGPSDVAASFGHPGRPDLPEVQALIRASQRKVLASGKQLIVQADTREKALDALRLGARVMLVGSDLQALTGGFSQLAKAVLENAR